jgi:hypothetical protein
MVTGPTKKKMPLLFSADMQYRKRNKKRRGTYATGDKPAVPAHPITIMANVEAEMTKLTKISYPCFAPASIPGWRRRISPDEPKRRGIGEALVVVTNMGNLGGQVKLLI